MIRWVEETHENLHCSVSPVQRAPLVICNNYMHNAIFHAEAVGRMGVVDDRGSSLVQPLHPHADGQLRPSVLRPLPTDVTSRRQRRHSTLPVGDSGRRPYVPRLKSGAAARTGSDACGLRTDARIETVRGMARLRHLDGTVEAHVRVISPTGPVLQGHLWMRRRVWNW